MKILCCQVSAAGIVTRSGMEAHQQRVAALLRAACENQSVELAFLPELSAIEYSQAAFENLAELAALSDGWLCASMAELARELNTPICFGMPRAQDEKVYISQLVVGQDGSLMACYDKVHIAQLGASMEQPYFTPGNRIAE